MSTNGYPDDVQFVGLVQAATAAADAQQRSAAALGKRKRESDGYLDSDVGGRPSEDQYDEPSHTPTLSSSAAVLFREPSEKSKKYSRPPLGKVYTSLELAPETFLRLQNAAKGYMLDDDHLERRDVVGHKKHSNNNDVAKLKLWQCVDEFLRMDNNGEKFFGHSAGLGIPDVPSRTFFWPEDHHKIIKLLMPLLRKMVTNERQRVYAAETRKQEPGKPATNQSSKSEDEVNHNFTVSEMADPDVDPSLQDVLPTAGNAPAMSAELSPENTQVFSSPSTIMLQVNIMTDQTGTSRRARPEFSLPSESISGPKTLLEQIQSHYDISLHRTEHPTIKVWLPDGLVSVKDDGEWMVALLSAGVHEWMNGQVKILVEI